MVRPTGTPESSSPPEAPPWDDPPPDAHPAPETTAPTKPLTADPRFAALQQLFPGKIVEWQEEAADKAEEATEGELPASSEADTVDTMEEEDR